MPEVLQRAGSAAEYVAFRFPDVGYTFRVVIARKITLAVSSVLPEVPLTPRRGVARFEMIVCDP